MVNVLDSYRPKLGKIAVADITLSDTVVRVGPLPAGLYVVEGSVAAYAIQCLTAVATPSAALLRAQGTPCPASTEVEFCVEVPVGGADSTGDGYVCIVQASGAGGGTARITTIGTRPVVADLA